MRGTNARHDDSRYATGVKCAQLFAQDLLEVKLKFPWKISWLLSRALRLALFMNWVSGLPREVFLCGTAFLRG